MARFDFAFDPNAARVGEWMGGDSSNYLGLFDANEAAIEAAGVTEHSYTAPGEGDRILESTSFYEMEVNGFSLVDWVDALLTGEPLEDVHCDECTELDIRPQGSLRRAMESPAGYLYRMG